MEADGLVSAETVIQTKYPNKRVFSLTQAGREECAVSAVPSPPGEFKDELVIKMLSIDVADPACSSSTSPDAASGASNGRATTSMEAMLEGQDAEAFAQNANDVGEYLWRLRSIGLMEEFGHLVDTRRRASIELRRPMPARRRTTPGASDADPRRCLRREGDLEGLDRDGRADPVLEVVEREAVADDLVERQSALGDHAKCRRVRVRTEVGAVRVEVPWSPR